MPLLFLIALPAKNNRYGEKTFLKELGHAVLDVYVLVLSSEIDPDRRSRGLARSQFALSVCTFSPALVAVKLLLEVRLGVDGSSESGHRGFEFAATNVHTMTTGVELSHFTTLRARFFGDLFFSIIRPTV